VLFCLTLFSGCGSGSGDLEGTKSKLSNTSSDVVEITEKMFISQCNDVYLNPADYEGKKVKIEGMLDIYTDENGTLSYGVFRNGPGCCGNDGIAGFEVRSEQLDLQIEDWIEVTGTFRTEAMGNFTNVVIEAEKVTRLEKRGLEFVTQ
jgi:uncharacterized membrane protein YcgQ (UPF0703/DUF1980 family)